MAFTAVLLCSLSTNHSMACSFASVNAKVAKYLLDAVNHNCSLFIRCQHAAELAFQKGTITRQEKAN